MQLDYTPFIVFGTSKSGTTWLQKILNTNPEVSCLFQRPIFPLLKERKDLFYPSKTVFNAKRSPYKGLFKDKKEEEKYHYELRQLNATFKQLIENIPDENNHLFESFKELYRSFAGSVLKVKNKKACGTKSYSDLDLFLKIFPEGKIITIVRDPRDVIISKRFHTYRMGAFFLGDENTRFINLLNRFSIFRKFVKSKYHNYLPILSENNFSVYNNNKLKVSDEALNKYAIEWVKVNEYILKIEEKYPGRLIRIKYEDLKDNFDINIKNLFEFLDVLHNNKTLELVKNKTKMPKVKGDNNFFRKGEKGDWVNHFNKKQLEHIRNITHDTANKLDY